MRHVLIFPLKLRGQIRSPYLLRRDKFVPNYGGVGLFCWPSIADKLYGVNGYIVTADNEDEIFLKSCRFPREEILSISGFLRPSLEKATPPSQAVPVELQVCVALRFYASETFQNVLGSMYALSQPTISQCLKNVTWEV